MLIAVKVWNEKLGLATCFAIGTIGIEVLFYSISVIHSLWHWTFSPHFMFSNMKLWRMSQGPQP